jgi:hypothetical protein
MGSGELGDRNFTNIGIKMATNEILPFAATDTGTNLLTQAEYLADSQRPIGNQPGIARAKLVNKAIRQASLLSAGVAQFLADNQVTDLTDVLTPSQISAMMTSVALKLGIPSASNTALANSDATLTAAQLIGGEFTITPTSPRILTTDTAENIIAAMDGSVNNSYFEITIVNNAVSNATVAAGTGVTLVGRAVISNGSGLWRVKRLTESTVELRRLDGISSGAASLGQNGYQVLPGGLILQWGISVTNASGDASVTLPITFPTSRLSGVASIHGNPIDAFVAMPSISTTTLVLKTILPQNGGGTLQQVAWFVLGK